MIVDRPKEVTEILVSLKYWDKKNLVLFMKNFIRNNCERISFMLHDDDIEEELNLKDEKTLRIEIINLLQDITYKHNVVLGMPNDKQ